MSDDDAFGRFTRSKEYAERQRAREDEAYEAGLVQLVLRRFHMSKRESELRSAMEARNGTRALSFSIFAETYRSFPIVFGVERFRKTPVHSHAKATLPALFKSFDQAPFVLAYEEAFEALRPRATDRAVGLVFPRKGIRGGLVIHDGRELAERVCGMVIQYTPHHPDKTGMRLFVQPFTALIDSIHNKGHGWQPD